MKRWVLVGILAILMVNYAWANPTHRDENYDPFEPSLDTVHEEVNDVEKRAKVSVFSAICYYTCQAARREMCNRYCGWSPPGK